MYTSRMTRTGKRMGILRATWKKWKLCLYPLSLLHVFYTKCTLTYSIHSLSFFATRIKLLHRKREPSYANAKNAPWNSSIMCSEGECKFRLSEIYQRSIPSKRHTCANMSKCCCHQSATHLGGNWTWTITNLLICKDALFERPVEIGTLTLDRILIAETRTTSLCSKVRWRLKNTINNCQVFNEMEISAVLPRSVRWA